MTAPATALGPLLAAGSVVTVGSFDGVHLGHRAVLDEIARRARAAGRRSVLVTFEPHPLEVLHPATAPQLLTTPAERREVLAESALDVVWFRRFDHALAALPPERFVEEVLVGGCAVRELVIGYDHGFGRGRSGDVSLLRRLGAAQGFAVDVVAPVEIDGAPVSSSRIRALVSEGDLAGAAALLGRPYSVSGRVVAGERRGRRLGVPTVNLGELDPRKLLPPDGVYAVRVEWRDGAAEGMMNQGPRPTFADGRRALEANLFGVADDLYGEWVRIEWVERLREVRRFDSAEELKAQLQRDRARAEQALRVAPERGPYPSRVPDA